MPLVLEVQRLVEAAAEIGLERRNPLAIEPLELLRATAEVGQLAAVAAVSDHQAPLQGGTGQPLTPPRDTFGPQVRDEGLRTLQLTPGRQHAARIP
jgi:hypothetical protein